MDPPHGPLGNGGDRRRVGMFLWLTTFFLLLELDTSALMVMGASEKKQKGN